MKRAILIVLGGAVVIAAAAIYFVVSSLDTLIQEAVESIGSEIIQAEVKLDGVELDPGSGRGALRGLMVGNPRGFKTPSAFRLGMVSISVDTGTVTGDTVVIKEIVVDKPAVTYELGADGSNIDAIRKNVDAYMGGGGGTAQKGEKGEGPKLVIENFYVRGGTVNVSATILEGKTLSAALPDIHLKDIGKEDEGATPGQVAEEILAAIGDGATSAVGSIGVGKTLDSLKKTLGGTAEGAGEAIGKAVEGVSGAVGEATEGVGDAAGEVGKKLKGLFGK